MCVYGATPPGGRRSAGVAPDGPDPHAPHPDTHPIATHHPQQEDTVAGQAAQDLRTELDELGTTPCEPCGAKG
ncbi:hypothetical protein SAV31267_010450 [Streptomyces avermitilis]|uniref:Uncharacterized protein n=1 Tax=Streptomyces avermitilis TaxID=33903 RepID=A0A4D4MHS8_STRAX|nr:hypothetical protein SAV31267_010450 [Streptomyces avermitilis]